MRRAIHFLLGAGRAERRIDDCDPTTTVLEHLRGSERRPGTKEGCAEGDCGACTVVLARPAAEGLDYRPVNACIQFLPTLDGAQLLTVEDLADSGALHPVQQALVERHGSQCGFCTPGIAMSLFAFAHGPHAGEPTRARIDEALAGNLCRCTGYGPIIAAARATARPADRFAAEADETRAALAALPDDPLLLESGGRRFFAPRTSDELATFLLEHPGATVLGGGTDVGLWVTKQHRRLETIVWTGCVRDFGRVEERDGHIVIGAGATYATARPWLARHWPDLDALIARIGSTQIRNVGTVGGNIANGSPIGDMPPPFIALGASVVLRHGATRRTLPLEDFFVAYGRQDRMPGEFVEAVRVPLPDPADRFACYKLSKRFEQDISALLGAYRLRLDDRGRVAAIRIAYGGMAGTPKRAAAAEAAMTGAPWTEATVARGLDALAVDYSPMTDMRASAGYRMRAAGNLLRRFFVETTRPDVATRLQAGGAA